MEPTYGAETTQPFSEVEAVQENISEPEVLKQLIRLVLSIQGALEKRISSKKLVKQTLQLEKMQKIPIKGIDVKKMVSLSTSVLSFLEKKESPTVLNQKIEKIKKMYPIDQALF